MGAKMEVGNGQNRRCSNAQAILGDSLHKWEVQHDMPADLFDKPASSLSETNLALREQMVKKQRGIFQRIVASFGADADAARTLQLDPERTQIYTR